jgi:tetratricopeptide (TPR) repeat protein
MTSDTRVNELVSRWVDAPVGAKPTPEALCAECPELLEAVRREVFANSAGGGDGMPPHDAAATLLPPSPAMDDGAPIADGHTRGRDNETIAPRGGPSSWFQPPRRLTDDDDDHADARQQSSTIKGYVKQSILGEGGMGVVWRAEQVGTRRVVALKTIAGSFAGSTRVQLRFAREVELAASLEHPYIARVYDGGISQGTYYCAMELVEGAPVTRYATDRALPRGQRLELMLRVCDGVRFAHENGVIHRDLKPSNVLVRADDGTPKILDFGLAKLIRDGANEGGLTLSGDVIGTPTYMAPEQARGDSARTDTRGDVWSLGAILFELLTGSPPFDIKGSYVDVVRRVAEEEPRRPRSLCPDLDRELEAILLKCLARDAAARYATAGELGDDLRRYLNGDPVAARPATALYFLRKRIARHKGRFALAGVVVLAALAGSLAYVVSIERERARTWQAKLESDRNAQQSVQRAQQAIRQRAAALNTIRAFTLTAQRGLGRDDADVKLRDALLSIARNGLEQISELTREAGGASADRDSAAASAVMAEIARTAGDLKRAESLYRQAVAQYAEAALGGTTADTTAPDGGAEFIARIRLARIVFELGDRAGARREVQDAAARLDVLLGKDPASPILLRQQWSIVTFLGDVSLDEGQATDALAKFEEARQLANAPAFTPADRALSQRRVAAACERLLLPPASTGVGAAPSGPATTSSSHARRRALAESAAAVELDRQRVAKGSPSDGPQIDLATSLLQLGRIQLDTGNAPAGIASAGEANAILRRLAAARPTDLSLALAIGDTFVVLLRGTPGVRSSSQEGLTTAARAHLSQLSEWEAPQSRIDAARLAQLRTSLGALLQR